MSFTEAIHMIKCSGFKNKLHQFFSKKFLLSSGICKPLVISSILIFSVFFFFYRDPNCNAARFLSTSNHVGNNIPSIINSTSSSSSSPTTLSHIVFGLQSSNSTCNSRKHYMESWWRPNITRGYVYLDEPPTGDLLPWSPNLPPYKVNDDLSRSIQELNTEKPYMPRMVHTILELFREEHEDMRWLIIGDDDTIFFVDNIVDVLSKYDHTKFYYIGHQSESVLPNFWHSFKLAFGGGGIILSYPLVKALVEDMDRCLRTYSMLSGDLMIMVCVEDLGFSLTQHNGLHQLDLRGDLSGFFSSHPKELLLSLHHMDAAHPYYPKMDHTQSLNHLMKAANMDQSRLFQQTICYHKQKIWSFSIAWGYSAQIYENIWHRSWLQTPVETFHPWGSTPHKPLFMFNTRTPSNDPCGAPHVFFLKSVEKNISSNEILTVYSRSVPRGLSACSITGNHSAEYISTIHVITPAMKRTEIQRCECCDVVSLEDNGKAVVRYRECMADVVVG